MLLHPLVEPRAPRRVEEPLALCGEQRAELRLLLRCEPNVTEGEEIGVIERLHRELRRGEIEPLREYSLRGAIRSAREPLRTPNQGTRQRKDDLLDVGP